MAISSEIFRPFLLRDHNQNITLLLNCLMGRPPCCDESGVKKGPWTPEEDQKLMDYISKHGHGSWRSLPKHAGLNRCGKSCRLRWTNYLRPDIKRGKFTEEEERLIINLHSVLGNKWSKIAAHLPGRTDNEIKNFWNTHIRKKLLHMGIDPETHKPRTDFNQLTNLTQLLGMSNSLGNSASPWGNNPLGLQIDVTSQLTKIQLLQNILQIVNLNPYMLGNHSLNPLQLEAVVNNGTIPSIHNKEAFLRGQEYANPGLVPQAQSEDISKVWTDHVEGGSSLEGSCFNNQNQPEMALPALVSPSGTVNQMESGCKTAQASTTESPSSSIFEAWEKLLDDETSGSDWKDILELSSTLASPISW